jgi:hypothetical protein
MHKIVNVNFSESHLFYERKMGKITDLNVTGLERAKFAASLGNANEYIVTGLLIRLGLDAAVMAVTGQPYDLLVSAFRHPKGERALLRCQIKTISKGGSIRFIGGSRGGVNRHYIPGMKTYKYTTEHNDLVIGVDVQTLDLYLVPTKFIAKWGNSIAISKLQPLKNNWDILLNWNNDFLTQLESSLSKQILQLSP